MTCPNCQCDRMQQLFSGTEHWCPRCGCWVWIRADGALRPRIPILTQQATPAELQAAAKCE